MVAEKRMATYRVYAFGVDGGGTDEYVVAATPQEAADLVREWYPGVEIVEVARVVKDWK